MKKASFRAQQTISINYPFHSWLILLTLPISLSLSLCEWAYEYPYKIIHNCVSFGWKWYGEERERNVRKFISWNNNKTHTLHRISYASHHNILIPIAYIFTAASILNRERGGWGIKKQKDSSVKIINPENSMTYGLLWYSSALYCHFSAAAPSSWPFLAIPPSLSLFSFPAQTYFRSKKDRKGEEESERILCVKNILSDKMFNAY